MTLFVRQLNTQTIGATLRSLRKRQGISLEMLARATNIQRPVIEAFERDTYHDLPDPVYARHFLRRIVEELHGDPEYFLSRFSEECGTCPTNVTELKIPRQRVTRDLLLRFRSSLSRIAISVVAFLVLLYVGYQLNTLLSPPDLLVDSPQRDTQTTSPTLAVSGQTQQEVRITINGQSVLTDPTGRFQTNVTLTHGLNIITIEAKKKYGRPRAVERSVFLEDLGRPADQETTMRFIPTPLLGPSNEPMRQQRPVDS